ncbi:unnamed protein product, partial [Discosporangium mesarthrocarpum]
QEEDVRKYVITRKFEKKGKTVTKRPNIQRLVTPIRLQRKRAIAAQKRNAMAKSKRDASEYARRERNEIFFFFDFRMKEQKEARRSLISKRRSSRKASAKAAA